MKKIILLCSPDKRLPFDKLVQSIDKISHIFFGPFNIDNNCSTSIENFEGMEQLYNLKCRYRWIKTMARFGGEYMREFTRYLKFTKDRSVLVQKIVKHVNTYGFDGIDIDIQQIDNFKEICAFVKELREHIKKLGDKMIITLTFHKHNLFDHVGMYVRDMTSFIDMFCITECNIDMEDTLQQYLDKITAIGLQPHEIVFVCDNVQMNLNKMLTYFTFGGIGLGWSHIDTIYPSIKNNLINSIFLYIDKVDMVLNRIVFHDCVFKEDDENNSFIRVPIYIPEENKNVFIKKVNMKVSIKFINDRYDVESTTEDVQIAHFSDGSIK